MNVHICVHAYITVSYKSSISHAMIMQIIPRWIFTWSY